MRSRRGVTLVEMLVALTLPGAVAGGIQGAARSHPDSFSRIADSRAAEVASLLGGGDECSAQDQQALVVFASAFRFGFEAGCVGGRSSEQLAASTREYYSLGGQVIEMPGKVPATDTVNYYFQADRSTPRTDDFVLMRKIGMRRPEAVLRNVLAYPGRPFFQYYYRKADEAGQRRTHPVPAKWLPLEHAAVRHGSPADTGASARIDTLRAVEVNYSLTNGRTGVAEKIQPVSKIVVLSTLTRKKSRPCEDEPLFSQASYRRATGCSPEW